MRHVTIENLMNYMDGQPTDVEKSTLEGHLTTCAECSQLNQEFQTLTTRLRDDSSFEPPAELVQWGVSLFQPVMQPESKGTIRKTTNWYIEFVAVNRAMREATDFTNRI